VFVVSYVLDCSSLEENGKKSIDIFELKYKHHQRRQEYVLGKVKVRLGGDHCQKTKICKDHTKDNEKKANLPLRQHMGTEESDMFLKPLDDEKLHEQDWFWLEPGDEGVDDPLKLAEKFKRHTDPISFY
jgi:hypothetical protein